MQDLENYTKAERIIDIVWANVFALLLIIPVAIILLVPYFFIWNEQFSVGAIKQMLADSSFVSSLSASLVFFIVMVIGIVMHEIIHGITWSFFTSNGHKSIKYGVMWKLLTPYCHCKEPLKLTHYIFGAIMPAVILGIIPSIIAIFVGNLSLLCFGMLFTIVAAGDFLIIYSLRNDRFDDMVLDHPTAAGCYVYRKSH